MNKQISHWMYQFPLVLIFIFVYYFSTQGDAALQPYTKSYTMTSKYILMQDFTDVLHLLWIPEGLKRNKEKGKKRGLGGRAKESSPFLWSSQTLRSRALWRLQMTLQSLADWMPLIFRPNTVASEQMHIFKPHQHWMYMVTDDALAMPRSEAKKKASLLWLSTTKNQFGDKRMKKTLRNTI